MFDAELLDVFGGQRVELGRSSTGSVEAGICADDEHQDRGIPAQVGYGVWQVLANVNQITGRRPYRVHTGAGQDSRVAAQQHKRGFGSVIEPGR
jgi:hypothetical protein